MVQEQLEGLDELGGIFVEIENQLSEAQYEQQFKEFSGVLEQSHKAGFAAESSPSGSKWPALKPATARRKGHDTILVESGRLEASLTEPSHSDAVRTIGGEGMFWGTEVPYSGFHQKGSGKLPQREHVGMNEETVQVAVDLVADHAVESMKIKM